MKILFTLTSVVLLSACVSQADREYMQQMGIDMNPCNGHLQDQYEVSIQLDDDTPMVSSIKSHCEPEIIEIQTEFEKENRDPAKRRW